MLLISSLTGISLLAGENSVTIHNHFLTVRFDAASGRYSLTAKPSGRDFVREGELSATGGLARIVTTRNDAFGRGQAIEVSYPDGHRDAIQLFPNLPFALFQSSLHNGGTAMAMANGVQTLSATIELRKPAGDLKTLGTGAACWRRTRIPAVTPGWRWWNPKAATEWSAGWLTQERGSGVVFSRVENSRARISAELEYGRMPLAPGQTEELETFAIGWFEDARLGLEQWADAVAKVARVRLPPQPVGYCTWYSKPHGGASDERHLAEQAAFAATNLAPYGFSVIQIDDGWQAGISTNGPKRNFTINAANGPYPGGMKAIADRIKAEGLVPGIWFMPFAGTYYDPFFQAHPEWFVKREGGAPYETAWGGTCLDLTNPDVQNFLRANIHRIGHEWGYQYFKMDGLWTGTATKQIYVNDAYRADGIGDAVFHDPGTANIQAYRSGLKLVRETAGPGIFILGCCTPQNMRSYGGAMGLVDAMRIGPDNGADWEGLRTGPTYGSRQYFLSGRVWYNDPDPIYVRAEIPLNHARLICSWVTISGQLDLSSEWLPGLPPERLDLLKRTMPSHGLLPRPADLFEQPIPRIWLLTDNRRATRRDIIGLFNWDDRDQVLNYPMERVGLDGNKEYEVFDYWQNELLSPIRGNLALPVPGQSCRVLAVRPQSDHPQLLSTSRHITQGIVDVLEEKWDKRTKTLHGRSKVVGGDPYELRIVLPRDTNWRVDSVELSPNDRSIGINEGFVESPELLRVTLKSPASREVAWSVTFKK